ncbi:hypothetical protein [Massilia sp. METH4]|uniref:hypothetical protein n=1 Tax=Massilia sp. METH4 TaxID=3123041 RepID=UPI0030CDF4F8
MSNLRIVYDNAAPRATLTASSTAGALVVGNLQDENKSTLWRATGTTARLTAKWATPEPVRCIALPVCNLSPTATMRVRLSTNPATTDPWAAPTSDSGVVTCCPAPARRVRGFTAAQAATAYAHGGGACAVVWLPAVVNAASLTVEIADAANAAGAIEAAALVIGDYWSPDENAGYDVAMTPVDTGRHERTAAGGLLTEAGTRYRTLSFSLEHMTPADRAAMLDIAAGNGVTHAMLVSLLPGIEDAAAERDHTLFGRLSKTTAQRIVRYRTYATTLELEEV